MKVRLAYRPHNIHQEGEALPPPLTREWGAEEEVCLLWHNFFTSREMDLGQRIFSPLLTHARTCKEREETELEEEKNLLLLSLMSPCECAQEWGEEVKSTKEEREEEEEKKRREKGRKRWGWAEAGEVPLSSWHNFFPSQERERRERGHLSLSLVFLFLIFFIN